MKVLYQSSDTDVKHHEVSKAASASDVIGGAETLLEAV